MLATRTRNNASAALCPSEVLASLSLSGAESRQELFCVLQNAAPQAYGGCSDSLRRLLVVLSGVRAKVE